MERDYVAPKGPIRASTICRGRKSSPERGDRTYVDLFLEIYLAGSVVNQQDASTDIGMMSRELRLRYNVPTGEEAWHLTADYWNQIEFNRAITSRGIVAMISAPPIVHT